MSPTQRKAYKLNEAAIRKAGNKLGRYWDFHLPGKGTQAKLACKGALKVGAWLALIPEIIGFLDNPGGYDPMAPYLQGYYEWEAQRIWNSWTPAQQNNYLRGKYTLNQGAEDKSKKKADSPTKDTGRMAFLQQLDNMMKRDEREDLKQKLNLEIGNVVSVPHIGGNNESPTAP